MYIKNQSPNEKIVQVKLQDQVSCIYLMYHGYGARSVYTIIETVFLSKCILAAFNMLLGQIQHMAFLC